MVINSMDGVAMCYLAQQHYDEAVQVLEQAFALLPNILHGPRYRYLHTSLSKHWQEAKTGQSTTIVAQADVI